MTLPRKRRNGYAFGSGALIGVLGGLIGLGGAEFRLPVLVSLFRFRILPAIVINLMVSLITVGASLVFRAGLENMDRLLSHWPGALNLLAGSLAGSYMGVHFATRIPERLLVRFVVVLLVMLSATLIGHEWLFSHDAVSMPGPLRIAAGLLAGFCIGAVSSLLGVAGGEMIIPTLVLLFGLAIKDAGTVSLAISVPTILMGLARYRRRPVFAEVAPERGFIAWMAAGSVLGAWAGSQLLPFVPGSVLQVFLGCILLISAWKMAAAHKPTA